MTTVFTAHAKRPAAIVATFSTPALVVVLLATGQLLLAFVVASFILGLGLFRDRIADALLMLGILSLTFSGIAVGPLTLPDLFLIPAGSLLLLRSFLRADFYIAPWALGAAALVTAGGILPHLLLTTTPPRGGIILFQFATSLLYVPIIMALATRSYPDMRRLAACYVLSAAISSLFGVLHFVGISDLASRLTGFEGLLYNSGRVEGFAAHPNQLGFSSALALPFNLYLFARDRRWAATLPLLAAGVMVSGSRAGLVAFLLCSIVALWRQGRFSLPALAKGFGLIIVTFAVANQIGLDAAIRRLVGAFPSVSQANEERNRGISAALDDIMQYPLTGVGFGDVPHNLYIELVHGAGLLALIGFLWYAKNLLRTAWLFGDVGIVHSAGVAMAVWLVTGLVQPGLYDRYLYFAPGILLAAHSLARRSISGRVPSLPAPNFQFEPA